MARTAGRSLAHAAFLIAGLTVLSRVVGFLRLLVFEGAVGQSCLATAYLTANALPNVIFEVVAGGALAGAVVPLVSRVLPTGADRADGRADVSQTVSALMCWALLLLTPAAVVCGLLAEPLMGLLLGTPSGCSGSSVVGEASSMFRVFAPQIPLYAVAVIAGGVLQVHGRFLAAAAAPLVSSAVVISTYAVVAGTWSGDRNDLAHLPDRPRWILALGTTAGVLALAALVALAMGRLGLRLRPTLRFPDGSATAARGLATAGVAALVAQQLTLLVVVAVSNLDRGGLSVYAYTWAVYLLPYAVLSVPIATSAFPRLSAAAHADDLEGFRLTSSLSARAVAVVSGAGAGLVAGAALPVAEVFHRHSSDPPVAVMARALVCFAPGLLGYGLVAHLTRTCFALGEGRAAASAVVLGWLVVAVISAVAGIFTVPHWRIASLGLANTAGMSLAALLLLGAVRRRCGRDALTGVSRALGAAAAGATLAGAVGLAVSAAVPRSASVTGAVLLTSACAAASLGAYLAALLVFDRTDLGGLLVHLPGRSSRG